MKYQIYCDLDGVLADFNNRFEEFSEGISPKNYEAMYGLDEFWDLINEIGVRFWVGIKWLPDGIKLWRYIKKYDPILLSAPSRDDSSKLGKRLWVKRHLPGVKLILTPAYMKREYANENSILIDDYHKNIREWEEEGGIGIKHVSYNDTIKQLKKLEL